MTTKRVELDDAGVHNTGLVLTPLNLDACLGSAQPQPRSPAKDCCFRIPIVTIVYSPIANGNPSFQLFRPKSHTCGPLTPSYILSYIVSHKGARSDPDIALPRRQISSRPLLCRVQLMARRQVRLRVYRASCAEPGHARSHVASNTRAPANMNALVATQTIPSRWSRRGSQTALYRTDPTLPTP